MNKQKVLVVDDELRNQRIISEILEDLVELKVCSSGEEALSVIEDFNPDLILLDIMMKGIDGYEVCATIRSNQALALTKVILVSGKAMIEERLKGYEVGADDYMCKPFVPEELLAKAKVFLRLSHIEREFSALNKDLEATVQERTSQLLEAEAKLISAAKMSALGEMAGGIAHEINTPLATIALLTDLLRGYLEEMDVVPTEQVELTENISKTVDRIGLIITGLRTFSRDGNNDSLVAVSVNEIVESTLSLCREKILKNGVELRIEKFPDDLNIACRQVQISQVLLNLIGNACDAVSSESERWVHIGAEKTHRGVRFSVTDSGKGLTAEAAKKLFQPFFTTKAIGKGTGLGLSISKGIITSHRGTLEIDKNSEHTRFVFEIPDGNEKSSQDRVA